MFEYSSLLDDIISLGYSWVGPNLAGRVRLGGIDSG